MISTGCIVNGAGSWWNNLSDLYIGFEGANNQLLIQSGARVTNNAGILGGNIAGRDEQSRARGRRGFRLGQRATIWNLGLLGGGNTVLATNGGRVRRPECFYAADGTYVGHFNGAGGNRLHGVWRRLGVQQRIHAPLRLRRRRQSCCASTEGGRLDSEVTYVGEFATASGNTIEVTGPGSLLRNSIRVRCRQ